MARRTDSPFALSISPYGAERSIPVNRRNPASHYATSVFGALALENGGVFGDADFGDDDDFGALALENPYRRRVSALSNAGSQDSQMRALRKKYRTAHGPNWKSKPGVNAKFAAEVEKLFGADSLRAIFARGERPARGARKGKAAAKSAARKPARGKARSSARKASGGAKTYQDYVKAHGVVEGARLYNAAGKKPAAAKPARAASRPRAASSSVAAPRRPRNAGDVEANKWSIHFEQLIEAARSGEPRMRAKQAVRERGYTEAAAQLLVDSAYKAAGGVKAGAGRGKGGRKATSIIGRIEQLIDQGHGKQAVHRTICKEFKLSAPQGWVHINEAIAG
jgi:hypothetical protein